MFAYMGGKKLHSKWISPYIPSDFKTYVEVFGGAMWIYWESDKTPVKTNIYNDVNPHLANIFHCAATNPEHYKGVLATYVSDIFNEEMFKKYLAEIFGMSLQEELSMKRRPNYAMAAKYMLCQLQTFAGNTNLREDTKIYRSPDPKHKFITYIEKFDQSKYLKKLDRLSVENMDCRELIKKYDSKDTFFYIDPPYYDMESYYTSDDFGHDDHMELCEMLKTTKGKWALSYYFFDELGTLFPRNKYVWHHEKTYSVNARTTEAVRIELLIMNYKTGLSFL